MPSLKRLDAVFGGCPSCGCESLMPPIVLPAVVLYLAWVAITWQEQYLPNCKPRPHRLLFLLGLPSCFENLLEGRDMSPLQTSTDQVPDVWESIDLPAQLSARWLKQIPACITLVWHRADYPAYSKSCTRVNHCVFKWVSCYSCWEFFYYPHHLHFLLWTGMVVTNTGAPLWEAFSVLSHWIDKQVSKLVVLFQTACSTTRSCHVGS